MIDDTHNNLRYLINFVDISIVDYICVSSSGNLFSGLLIIMLLKVSLYIISAIIPYLCQS